MTPEELMELFAQRDSYKEWFYFEENRGIRLKRENNKLKALILEFIAEWDCMPKGIHDRALEALSPNKDKTDLSQKEGK